MIKQQAVKVMFRGPGAEALLTRLPAWRGTLILAYHRVGDPRRSSFDRRLFSADAAAFERQLRFLVENFEVATPDGFDVGALSKPGRRVLLTFDDGYRDLYTTAFPILEAAGVKAAMFLCTGFVDGLAQAWWDEIAWMLRASSSRALAPGAWSAAPLSLSEDHIEASIGQVIAAYKQLPREAANRLVDNVAEATGSGRRPRESACEDWVTWDMAREMSAAGHLIGAHTVTHPVLSQIPVKEQLGEIAGSVGRVEAEIGRRPSWLAYPVGIRAAFTSTTCDAARTAGIELAFSNYGGHVPARKFFPLDLRRVGVSHTMSPELFKAKVMMPRICARPSRRATARRGSARRHEDQPARRTQGD